jgi:glucoamylase
MMVLRSHRSKYFRGAGVASLTVPWGQARGDDDLGGYHLVWVRDLVEQALGLLAGGATEEAAAVLSYLRVTQLLSGGWPQDMWLDGSANSDGIQLDEAALPILLVDLAGRESAIDDGQVRALWPMVRAAAVFLVKSGPSTGQDRWENTPGLSPYTLATEIAALLVAARMAEECGEKSVGEYFRQTADLWNDFVEPWTFVTDTPLAEETGVRGYYIRIAPSPGINALLDRGCPPKMHQARDLAVTRVVSPDALALVRFGLRSPDDPRIADTVKVIDYLTRVDLPAGPSWRRYNGGYYGESDDGAPYTGGGKKTGHGRCWPLLTGERGHYELMAGRTESARRMLAAMGGFASQIGLLPEQLWDAADLPERHLFRGRPSGSAMPLAWTHSEYIRLLRSLRDDRVFDRPRDSYERYVRQQTRSGLALWRFDHQPGSFPAHRRLRIELLAPAIVHFSTDGWRHVHEISTRDPGLGIHVADLPTENMEGGGRCVFTFRWPSAANRWEGRDFALTVDPPRPESDFRFHADWPWTATKQQISGAK